MSELPSGPSTAAPSKIRPAAWLFITVGLLATVDLVAMALYVASAEQPSRSAAIAVILALAALVIGGLLGFLFGVPRAVADDQAGPSARSRGYRTNTNLEQISDWLTKILVGVGLTQIGSLREAGAALVGNVAPALGDGPDALVFAAALLLFHFVVGFLGGWVATRLYLTSALSQADRALDAFIAAEAEHLAGNESRAEELRGSALQILTEARELPRQYEELRTTLPASTPRTAAMESIISAARRSGAAGIWRPDQVKQLFDTGQDGDRIYSIGLMEGDATLVDFACVFDALANPRSRFELYHAMQASLPALQRWSRDERDAVEVLLREKLDSGQIWDNTDRKTLALRVVADLERLAEMPTTVAPVAHP